MNIKFYNKLTGFLSSFAHLRHFCYVLAFLSLIFYDGAYSTPIIAEPVQACVIARDERLTDSIRAQFAHCLGWQKDLSSPLCHGYYQPIIVSAKGQADDVHILADNASLYRDKRSTLSGHVQVQQNERIVNAQTAYVYRDATTNKVSKIEFLGEVRYLEPDRMMIARKAMINPEDKSGQAEDVLYRFNINRKSAVLPAWGRASIIQRFANQDYLLRKVTYTTCAPQDKAWNIEADSIRIDNANGKAVARNAVFRIHDKPIFYSPYLSFPTNHKRKSGFLLPIMGYSNIGGFDLGLPYYWNIATNQDLTLTPHYYSERGVMFGGEYRYLTRNSTGTLWGNFLPKDQAYGHFLDSNVVNFPWLQSKSTNRWFVGALNTTAFTPNLQLNVNAEQVSDDYYFQDFSANLALLTQRQLLRQADLTYTTDHWLLRGMGQSYQTLHPLNESPVSNIYERLPQLMARGVYSELPLDSTLTILTQYDQFHWPSRQWSNVYPFTQPEGPRFHLNPVLALPQVKSWGYLTPSVQVVENYYQVENRMQLPNAQFNRLIPRYAVDSGLFLERSTHIFGQAYKQTLEPRLFYLNVPYVDQTNIPVYDSGNMIFNYYQLFRTNRFSGYDRIGDANQLAYALSSRWLFDETGAERASISIGQIKYFANRRVELCQSPTGYCFNNPNAFGNLSSVSGTSPIASRATFNFNPFWGITGDYIWDPATHATNNADLNVHYQPELNRIVAFGYSYLVNGDMTQVKQQGTQNNSLHQATVSAAWPVTDRWSAVAAYNYNISKNYSMMSLAGLQYDTCCWAIRALGGRTFQSLSGHFEPQYNNNVYLQVLFKGLGSVTNSDPSSILTTYIPGYNDQFKH